MKLNIALLLCCLWSATAWAQQGSSGMSKRTIEKIEAYRVAFITERLDLNSQEAQQFWPLYNEYTDKRRLLSKRAKLPVDNRLREMSEDELTKIMTERLRAHEAMLNLDKTYIVKLREVIPLRKVVLLERAEKDFKAALLRRMRDWR